MASLLEVLWTLHGSCFLDLCGAASVLLQSGCVTEMAYTAGAQIKSGAVNCLLQACEVRKNSVQPLSKQVSETLAQGLHAY